MYGPGILLGSVLTAWKWPLVGGVLLILEGMIVCLEYPTGFLRAGQPAAMLFVLLTLGAPPIAGGLLALSAWYSTPMHPTV
jgi:hypothetical protein